ncbi:MAG TPA: hypothetical protein VMZ28_23555 [Kofleriaceae bacterium]|nr:hypothetical protein [Kofleriaceae bacterium]
MKQTYRRFALVAWLAAAAPACVGDIADPPGDDVDDDDDGEEELACEQLGRTYTGIGGALLQAGRVEEAPYSDRRRMKPFSALPGEYARVLGNQAAETDAFAATFGKPPARWFEEPEASANTLYASFTLAFQGCTAMTATGEDYAAAPTEESAAAMCASFARRFWDRNAEEDELTGCIDYAVSGTTSEADPRRRWAYTCASVLTAAGFVSY